VTVVETAKQDKAELTRGQHRRGVLVLMFVTFLWGTTFVVLQQVQQTVPPSAVLASRFVLAALCFLPFIMRTSGGMWLAGLELGAWLCVGYGTQAVGLLSTTVERSAFVTTLHVVIVPLVVALMRHRVQRTVWVGAGLALLGTALLCNAGGRPTAGDAWTALCAVAWAGYIVRLEAYSKRFASLPLTVTQTIVVAVLCVVWAACDPSTRHVQMSAVPWLWLVYLGVITTAGTVWLQTVGQRHVPAPQAAVIYSMEPVWASVIAFAVIGSTLTAWGLAGAGAIVAGMLVAQWRGRSA